MGAGAGVCSELSLKIMVEMKQLDVNVSLPASAIHLNQCNW